MCLWLRGHQLSSALFCKELHQFWTTVASPSPYMTFAPIGFLSEKGLFSLEENSQKHYLNALIVQISWFEKARQAN